MALVRWVRANKRIYMSRILYCMQWLQLGFRCQQLKFQQLVPHWHNRTALQISNCFDRKLKTQILKFEWWAPAKLIDITFCFKYKFGSQKEWFKIVAITKRRWASISTLEQNKTNDKHRNGIFQIHFSMIVKKLNANINRQLTPIEENILYKSE